jgi:hypothetical protein
MKHSDRLRRISIGCLVIAALGLAFDILSHGTPQFHAVTLLTILLATALEAVRLELRDLREEMHREKVEG